MHDTTSPPQQPTAHQHKIYVPGYVVPKILTTLFGICLVAVSMTRLAPALYHMLTGLRADAEAVHVIKRSRGGVEQIFSTDAQINASLEKRDRNFVFFNEYRFHSADGQNIDFRAPVGSFLRPHRMLMDDDGMPTLVPVWYDRHNPHSLTLPAEFSTWFLPGTICLFGLLTTGFGAVMWYYANKPIEMPDLHDPKTDSKPAPVATGH